jgi:SecD/SecF fusion protein
MQRHRLRTFAIWAAIVLSLIYVYPTLGWMSLTDEERQARLDRWAEEDEVYREPSLFGDMWHGIKRWAQFDRDWVINLGLDLQGGVHMVLGLDLDDVDWKHLEERYATTDRKEIVKQLQETALQRVRLRVDQFEAQEPLIQAMGDRQIQIQLPGEKDVRRAQELIKKTAFLSFHIVAGPTETRQVYRSIEEKFPQRFLPFMTRRGTIPVEHADKIRQVLAEAAETPGVIPDNLLVLLGPTPQRFDEDQNNIPIYVVNKEPIITGGELASAAARPNPETPPDWMILFNWKPEAADQFYKATSENVGKPMAIVLDDVVLSAPNIRQAIHASGVIEGSFIREQAQDLAIALNSGAMPVPVREEYAGLVGPTLGRDSIRYGLWSAGIGLVLVLLIVPFYYRLGGLITDIALLLNALMLLATMAYLDATLTLPGIAGLILSVAMAVDANVLVFERMREERRKGHSLLATIDAGYKRATVTVLDSNITTLISAAVLMQFGTGPVQGFAVALFLGVLISLFTSLTCTRAMYDFLTNRDKIKDFRFRQAIPPDTTYRFMDKRFIAFTVSGIVILIGIGAFVYREIAGPSNFGVDFTTGTNMQIAINSDEPVQVGDVRERLTEAGFEDARVQEFGEMLDERSNRFLIHLSEIAGEQAPSTEPAATTEGAEPAATTEGAEEAAEPAEVGASAIAARVQEALAPLAGGDAAKVVTEGVTMVGPAVGATLIRDALWAIFYSTLFIMAYLWFRFELVFALASVVALVHDVLITIGLFALSGQQISMGSVAAILTVIGYSLNDTIVVFDRVREDMALYRGKGLSYLQIMDRSVNETLARTILTAVTTIVVLLVLYVIGGAVLRDFAFILLVGIVVGTFSSIFVASPAAYYLQRLMDRLFKSRRAEKVETGTRRRPQRRKPSEEEATI